MMIRYAYDRKLGHVYYELMPGGELREVEPRVVLAALNAKQPALVDQPAAHWSPWLEWRGGPCPLPSSVSVQWESHPETLRAGDWNWRMPDGARFRYRADNPAGWLPRGDWMPPAELWAEGCPVRCEWMRADSAGKPKRFHLAGWSFVTHIRLVAREAKAGLPDLPEFVSPYYEGEWFVQLGPGRRFFLDSNLDADDLDRIAEACTKLAARERARRAQS